jgi:hypothetical protein
MRKKMIESASSTFEYETVLVGVSYKQEETGVRIFKKQQLPVYPEPRTQFMKSRHIANTWQPWGVKGGSW